jgi:hypothetical protein
VFQLVSFRFVKGFWVGMLFDMGYVYPDEPAAPAAAGDAPAEAAAPTP